jgi:conjugative transposon TraK protein
MFTTMKNIDTAFRSIRLFMIVFLVCATLLCGYTIYSANETVRANRGKVYVLVNGKLVEAVVQDRNIPVELKDHITDFHQYFFTLSPDEKAIKEQITKALYLADGSAKKMYENMKEAGYYNDIITGNITQKIQIENIELNMTAVPYSFRCKATLEIKRPTVKVIRNLITQGYIETGYIQSDNNNHGFQIQRWEIIENQDIKTTTR